MAKLEIVVLGCSGGPFESNLSSYFLIDVEKKQGILLDAGSLLNGLKIALQKGAFKQFDLIDKELSPPGVILTRYLKAYLITHAHLDHIAALVAVSPVDSKKPIYGIDETIDVLHNHVFNGKIWPNYVGEDSKARYQYHRLHLGHKERILGTRFIVEPFLLNHAKTLFSSAFLIECGGDYVLYFGDTSTDALEKSKQNEILWKKVAPLVREKKLKALFLECSYPDASEEQALFGHLNPKFFFKELETLANLAGSIESLKVIVTHMKENITLENPKDLIIQQLKKHNALNVDLIFPEQGMSLFL